MKVVLLIGAGDQQRALAHRLHSVAPLSEIGVIRPQRHQLAFKDGFLMATAGLPLRVVWRRLLAHYRQLYPDLPLVPFAEHPGVNAPTVHELIERVQPDLVLVSGTDLLRQPLIEAIERTGRAMNLHTGISPFIRGGPNCTNWALALGEFGLIGNTVMWLDAGIDTGRIVATERTNLSGRESLFDLHFKVLEHAHDLYARALELVIKRGEVPGRDQRELGKGRLFLSKQWTTARVLKAVYNFHRYYSPAALAARVQPSLVALPVRPRVAAPFVHRLNAPHENESPASSYRSLYLSEDSPHQKYHGWRVVEELPGLRVLHKRRGLLRRTLMLLSREGLSSVEGAVARVAANFGLRDLFIHDFQDVLGDNPHLGNVRFRRADNSERLLNQATFVIDLTKDETSLLAALSADYRRKIRKAEKGNLVVNAYDKPDAGLIAAFAKAFAVMASERHLSAPRVETLSAMYAKGNAVLFVIRRGLQVTNYLHVYTGGRTALFMYGVNPSKENDGAGQFLHWSAMRELRQRGFLWYDLGGVASLDRSNGIFNFKEKFGGELVMLGSEWVHVGSTLKPLLAASALRRRLQIRSHGNAVS